MSTADPADQPRTVTGLLHQASQGDRDAFDRLLPLVYDELKQIARKKLRSEREGHTLNTTALVHEAYLKLVDQTQVEWQSRSHFFAIASQAMRRILIDYAKFKKAAKRSGGASHVPLHEMGDAVPTDLFTEDQANELIALDDALHRLSDFNERGAQVVQYRYFGGLSHQEIADVLGTSEVTVRRAWTMARAWLKKELETEGPLA